MQSEKILSYLAREMEVLNDRYMTEKDSLELCATFSKEYWLHNDQCNNILNRKQYLKEISKNIKDILEEKQ